ncbi:cupin domain-containing protein [Pseudomonas stutzeri]|nr:cupin domain-containing protein [Stutzerimonas stutzeri]
MDVGARLQAIRKLKGLSQRELAKRAGVTNSTISMIEKNSVSPSISSLKKVLGGIPMSLVEFFSMDLEEGNQTQVVYKSDELIDIGSGAVTMKLVGRMFPNRVMSFLDETYPPGADTGMEMLNHEGEEAGVVVDGRLELTVGDEVYILGSGDSYYFRSDQPHRFRNPFDVPARLISATTPANF